MLSRLIAWSLLVALVVTCVTCFSWLVIRDLRVEELRHGAADARAERAARGEGDIHVGIVVSKESEASGSVLKGARLACEEVNEAGGVLGRKIRLIEKDDGGRVPQARRVAQELADDLRVVAVLGHSTSSTTLATATTYEYYGIVLLAPTATSPGLTWSGARLVFRTIPGDDRIGEQIAHLAAQEGIKSVIIYCAQDEYGRGLANGFERHAAEHGLTIVDRVAYEPESGEQLFERDLRTWKRSLEFDAIVLAAYLPEGAHFVKVARELGLHVPIFAGSGLDSPDLVRLAGPAANGVRVVSVFDRDGTTPETKRFASAFRTRYEAAADTGAAQGYDAMKVLAHAFETAGTTVPRRVAETLRSTRDWPGVTGPHTFTESGDVTKPIIVKVVREGRFERGVQSQPDETP